jgi:hypothetical protein
MASASITTKQRLNKGSENTFPGLFRMKIYSSSNPLVEVLRSGAVASLAKHPLATKHSLFSAQGFIATALPPP